MAALVEEVNLVAERQRKGKETKMIAIAKEKVMLLSYFCDVYLVLNRIRTNGI